ncbi:hypothetical protein VP01_8348g1, partial [Puccinia sorghi]
VICSILGQDPKVKFKPQMRDPEFDDVKNFFSEPYFCKGDVPDNKPPSTYKCFWCKKEVHVSGRSLFNLWNHQDGTLQTGKVSDGCPQHQKAIDKGAKLLATSLKEIKIKKYTKEGLISIHFNQAESVQN